MEEQVFCDGVGTISLIAGTVRVDLVALSATEKEANGQPKAVVLERLIMVPEVFVQAAEKMQSAASAMAKAGLLPRHQQPVQPTAIDPPQPSVRPAAIEPPPAPQRPAPIETPKVEPMPARPPFP